MTEVYSRCLSCRAYLGASTPELAEPFSALKMGLVKERAESRMGYLGPRNSRWLYQDDAFIAIARDLIEAAYWSRIWTLQECVLPPCMLYMYGEGTITFRSLSDLGLLLACDHMYSSVQGIMSGARSKDELWGYKLPRMHYDQRTIAQFQSKDPPFSVDNQTIDRTAPRRTEIMSMSAILPIARSSRATDPRDKIYGILALLPKEVAQHVNISYAASNTYEQTILDFTLTCFDQMGDLNILAATERSEGLNASTISWLTNLQSSTCSFAEAYYNISKDAASVSYSANLNIRRPLVKPVVQGRILICEGAFVARVEDISSGRSRRGRETYLDTQARVAELDDEAEDVDEFDDSSWKLSIARVLLGDPEYEFTGSLSMFDMPLLPQEEIDPDPNLMQMVPSEGDLQETNIPWKQIYMRHGFCYDFMTKISSFATFLVGNKPFASYFTSQDEFCPSQDALRELEWSLLARGIPSRPLFTTVGGRLGLCSDTTQAGDHVIVLADCCTPLIVREFGEHYKIVSPCYIDGFMNGELADGIAKGKYQLKQVSFT